MWEHVPCPAFPSRTMLLSCHVAMGVAFQPPAGPTAMTMTITMTITITPSPTAVKPLPLLLPTLHSTDQWREMTSECGHLEQLREVSTSLEDKSFLVRCLEAATGDNEPVFAAFGRRPVMATTFF